MNLDDATMKAAVAKAVIDTLTPEKREELLTNAVQHILSAKESSNYNSPTLIQGAFNSAVAAVARETAMEQITKDPEVKAKIEGLIKDAWAKVTGEEYSSVVEKVADAIRKGLTGDRY